MKANLGFLLIGLGLVGVYIALGGKFKRGVNASQSAGNASSGLGTQAVGRGSATPVTNQPFSNNPVPVAGGASQPANVPNLTGNPSLGSGGESIQSHLTQLGHMLVLYPTDRHASRGGFGR